MAQRYQKYLDSVENVEKSTMDKDIIENSTANGGAIDTAELPVTKTTIFSQSVLLLVGTFILTGLWKHWNSVLKISTDVGLQFGIQVGLFFRALWTHFL